ncbi:MAG: hypothetical protein HDR13_11145 [Lachnospiraceae bacterium]|nr:hypothetical protein [Lachnospiraceae bacterium]
MKKRTKVFRVILYVLLALVIARIAYFKYDLMPKYYKLTDKEREFLDWYNYYYGIPAPKRFIKEMLYKDEIRQIEWLRRLYADLEERYPGYQFYISGKKDPGMFGAAGYSEYYTEEETTGRDFDTHVYFKDGDYAYEEDNFYRYFVEEEYAEYVGGLLKEKGVDKVVKTGGAMSTVMGKECDSTITVEEIVNKYIEEMSPSVWIFLEAKGMTEEECAEYAKWVQEKLEEINLRGTYSIYFCDMTGEEIVSSEMEDMIFIYIHRCQSWNWGKEEEE